MVKLMQYIVLVEEKLQKKIEEALHTVMQADGL
jgi:hypothetical protein